MSASSLELGFSMVYNHVYLLEYISLNIDFSFLFETRMQPFWAL